MIDIAKELGFLSAEQAKVVLARERELNDGGIRLSPGQVLLERRFITPQQLRALSAELNARRAEQQRTLPPPATTLINTLFGQYQILESLADSGRSRVFLARDNLMARLVVLKVLPEELAADEQWYFRFRREVQLAGRLSHRNIVTAYGAGTINNCPYLALEYVNGESLSVRLEREGNVAEKTAWMIAREIAKALSYAEEQHIMHRDIKPANILCGNNGCIKLCDMGLSKGLNDASGLTLAGMAVGTPFYMSPEQACAAPNIDRRSDIYSLGCTVFHMLTGSVPFVDSSITAVMRAHLDAPRPDPRTILPEISERSSHLVRRMMALRHEERPEDADSLIADIEAMLPSLSEPNEVERPLHRIVPSEESTRKCEPYKFFPPEVTWTQQFMNWLRSWVE